MNDLDRLRHEYNNRRHRMELLDLYSTKNPAFRYIYKQRHNELLSSLIQNGVNNLAGLKLLEVGCGSGGVLHEYLNIGISASALFGIDLLFDRLLEAQNRIPIAGISNADGQNLPFPEEKFDLVVQYTAFSSVLDPIVKKNMALEMLRVLKPQGRVIWYDFWWNPTNRQTKGITPREIKLLFPNSSYQFQKITLAPPITRKLISFSKKAVVLLEKLGVFNTHYLAIIKKL